MAKVTVFSISVEMTFEELLDSRRWRIGRIDGCMEEKWSRRPLRIGLSRCRSVVYCRVLIQKFSNGGAKDSFDGGAAISSIEETFIAAYKECKAIRIESAEVFGTMDHAKDDTLDDARRMAGMWWNIEIEVELFFIYCCGDPAIGESKF